MKLTPVFGLVISVIVSILTSNNAMAASTVYPGSICHNYEAKNASSIEFYGHGVTNNSTSVAKKVICPLVRHINDNAGISIRVNLDAPRNTVSCTLYTYGSNGKGLGAQTVKNQTSGIASIFLKTPVSTVRSHSSMVCSLPPKEAGEIFSIEVFN